MKNCLFTKLKGVVDNDNLDYYDCVNFKRVTGGLETSTLGLFNPGSTNLTLEIKGDGTFNNGTKTAVYTPNQGGSVTTTDGNYKIIAYPKANFATTGFTDNYSINLNQISYSGISQINGMGWFGRLDDILTPENITLINLYSNKISGSFSALKKFVSVTTLNCVNNTAVEGGDISELGNMTSLTSVRFPANCSGSIEGFVSAQRTAGRTEAASITIININNNNGSIKWQNQVIETVASSTLSWTASTITFNGETITA